MTLFPKTRPVAAFLGLLLTGILLWQTPVLAQETTGTVLGVVKDNTGALVPGASVVLVNLDNKTQRKTVSGGSGSFSISSVTPDLHYRLAVTMSGFKTWQSQSFPIQPGDRVQYSDIKLQIGEATTQVTVEGEASQAVKPLDTPERSDIITARDLETLAVEGRDATELIEMLPGFTMISPGVNNESSAATNVVGVNNSTTGSFSANGAGPTGLETILDGVSLTNIESEEGTTQNINVDMVQDVKVDASTFSAAMAKGPAVMTATTKAGGSSYHGELYLYGRDTVLNANDWYYNYLRLTRPAGRYFYPGAQIGGPLWIPGTRFTRHNDKLFFFAGFEYYNQLYSPEALGSWVPTMAERNGDFSVANLNAQLCGGRPDGLVNPNSIQPMCWAENFLPNSTSVYNGQVQSYVDPNGAALLNWLPLPNADPFQNFSGYNYVQPVTQSQNGTMFHARVDYTIGNNDQIYAAYGRQSQITQNPVNLGYIPNYAAEYPGGVTTGDISNVASITWTHVFSPTVTNTLNVAASFITDPANMGNPDAVDRFKINGYNCNNQAARASGSCGAQGGGSDTSGNGNFNYIGEYKNSGDYSVPALSDYSELGYPNMLMPGGFYSNSQYLRMTVPDIQETVSWNKGPHFFQFGFYWEKGIINGSAFSNPYPQGEYTFNPGNSFYEYENALFHFANNTACQNPQTTGTNRASGASWLGACLNPNAMMYMGTPDSFTQANFTPDVDMNYSTVAGFANDQWKLHRLTLTLGVRLEHLGPWTDRHGNGIATFSPALYNQECTGRACAGTQFPGVTWHGLDSSISNAANNPATVYASPRLGLAWDVFGRGKTVIRGGWGIYRQEEDFAPYAAAAATAQGFKETYIQQTMTLAEVDDQSPIIPPDFNVYVISPKDTQRPIYYEYNGALSQRLNWDRIGLKDSLLEIAYVGSNSQDMSSFNPYNGNAGYNEASDVNVIPAGFMFNPNFDAGAAANSPLGEVAGTSIGTYDTAGQDFYRPYPFYEHIYQLNHHFYGDYNSVQLSYNKSSGHIQFGANYTFQKTLATGASYTNQLVDPINLRNDYNPPPSDRSQVFNVHYLFDFGHAYHGDRRWLGEAANGWQISGFSTVQSGPDLASEEQGNFYFGSGQLEPTALPTGQQNQSGDVPTPCETIYGIPAPGYCTTQLQASVWLGSPDYLLTPNVVCNPQGGKQKHQYINPACFAVPLPGGPSGLSQNPSGQGMLRLPYIHGPYYQDHNISLLKDFGMGGERRLQLRIEAFNPFNHPLVSFNNNDNTNLNLGNLYNATAGQPLSTSVLRQTGFGVANIKYGYRLLELGGKYYF
ncbi:MAG TPA: carboxypeptidase-like regulatory domain-containing protein [Acidobacteriaceae bacterium]|jgi:hypothetical protein|nr:carboxypeptidase-like regulatory domain-containing protein [Acidobacteriaceae bacterium]